MEKNCRAVDFSKTRKIYSTIILLGNKVYRLDSKDLSYSLALVHSIYSLLVSAEMECHWCMWLCLEVPPY